MPATLRHLTATFLLLCSSPLFASSAEETDMFNSLFSYEVNNRAFSLLVYGTMAEKLEPSPQKTFFETATKLEQLNQRLYAPYIKQYGLTPATGGMQSIKLDAVRLAYWLFPESIMAVMNRAGDKYMLKLQQLLKLAPEADKPFFEYVVAAEQAVVDAGHLIVASQDYPAATQLLETFIAAHQ